MLRRILLPLDGTAHDDVALAAARDLARHVRGTIVLLHVEPGAARASDSRGARRRFSELAEQLRGDGLDAAFVLDHGAPARRVAQTATDEHVDLIVVAPHHRSFLAALRDPGVTMTLLGQAPTPLLILPVSPSRERTPGLLADPGALVVVPVDGSKLAEQALPVAIQFARTYARPLLLVRVVPMPALTNSGAESLAIDQRMAQEEEVTARHYLATVRQRIGCETAAVPIQTMILYGNPVARMLRLGEDLASSLMVLGTRGHSGLARIMFGSVTAAVVRHSSIPLVVVPPLVREHAYAEGRAPAARGVLSLA
jgi:nucleotide-binding universal stress UspA family protein